MKNFKRFTAAVAATLMAASLSIPMAMNVSAATTENPITITITPVGNGTHTYTAYPIFKGTAKTDGTILESPTWANSEKAKDLVDAMLANTTLCPKNESGEYAEDSLGALLTAANTAIVPDAAAVAKALKSVNSNTPQADALAKVIASKPTLVGTAVTTTNNVISITQDGYYVITDTLTAEDKTNTVVSSYILKVAGNENLEIDAKAALPSVDKQIQDENDDAEAGATDGWGETADHAIGEVHSFKLIATIPKNANFTNYTSYKLVFHDTMSTGLTFDDLTSVKVKYGTAEATTISDGYTKSEIGEDNSWTLTIDDIISKLSDGQTFGEENIVVEVEYTAHLNENATSYDANSTTANAGDNNNKVYLEYSNNPNAEGLGKTTEDYVYDYCYTVKNIKKKNSTDGDVLAGATFNLMSGETAITFKWNSTKNAYVPATGEGASANIVSQADGTFNIIGLDAGTYTLKETVAPEGYNLATDTTVTISATHVENEGTPTMTLNDTCAGMNNTIVDTSGSSLPSTGGMGTTLFYLGGGAMVAVAGIVLITKKRMGKNNAE